MSKFSLEKELPPTRVTLSLIGSIEKYLSKRLTGLLAKPDEEIEELLKVRSTKITDSLGTEVLSSIEEFSPILFPDTTSSVEIELSIPHGTSVGWLAISLKFHLDRTHSRLRITYEGTAAREFVGGLYEGILQCVETSPSRNAFFNPQPFTRGVIEGIIFFIVIAQFVSLKFGPPLVSAVLSTAFAVMFIVWHLAPRFRTYTVFDSDRANRNERAWDWIVKGLLGFLIFGTLLASMRDFVLERFR